MTPTVSTANLSNNGPATLSSATTASSLNEVAVKVAVRVRPLNNREKLHQHQPCVRIIPESNQIVIGKDKAFSFDYVIPPKVTQAELFEKCVKNLVHNVFEGYNATVFAYGQTGAGKTHTISGNKSTADDFGIIPRAVNAMFQIISSNQESALLSGVPSTKEYCVKVNFIEIYKEELKDLLDPSEKDLQIREDEAGNTTIYGANEVICTTLEEVLACFDSGTLLRHTGSTLMNEQSSRSHSVFTVSIEQRWADPNAKSTRDSNLYDLTSNNPSSDGYFYLGAKFHFVDLAGSERVNRTGNVGDRFKESIHINSGLLALGNVISALGSNESKRKVIHVPYRESKITRILKDSLGGNANTLMICCISPSSCNLDESLNAVKYASRARNIKNKPIVNMDPQTQRFVEMQSEIKALREELHRQRTYLMTAAVNNMPNESDVTQLEEKLQSSQIEADQYKKLVKEAYSRFKHILKLDNSQAGSSCRKLVDEWLNIFEASKKADFDIEDYAKQKISQLESQLKEAMEHLKSDEEIFRDKEAQIKAFSIQINELESKLANSNRYLEESFKKEKEQQELMLQLQIQLDQLMQSRKPSQIDNSSLHKQRQNDAKLGDLQSGGYNGLKNESGISSASSKSSSSSNLNSKNSTTANQENSKANRAKTAPNAQAQQLSQQMPNGEKKARAAFSSPASFTLERVMQSFRARSQLLAETLEENDCVLQNKFNSTFDIENGIDEADEDAIDNSKSSDFIEDDILDENDPRFVRKGTFKVSKPKKKIESAESIVQNVNNNNKDEYKRSSSVSRAETPQDLQKKVRDLSINIKMKEELIKELVANSKFTNRLNLQYQHKIESLQKESTMLKNEINDLKMQIQLLPASTQSKDPTKIEAELRKKLELAQQRINDLEAKQRDTTKFLNSTTNTDKKINELELALGKMKQQNESLQKRIKEDADKKIKLEKELEKEQQKLKDLEVKNDQQQKILKKKTEDLMQAQRRLRSGSTAGLNTADDNMPISSPSFTNNKHWVEQEMEKIVQEKKQMELFKDELEKREELVRKKEYLLKEKNELEMKKLRSSQAIVNNKDHLEETHNNLLKQRKNLDDKLNKGDQLTSAEERRLIEIEEAIEALEIAIDFENESIKDHQIKLKDSILLNNDYEDSSQVCDQVLDKLNGVPYEETKLLVRKFFQKIIDLKEIEQKKNYENGELQLQIEEQNQLVDQLKQALNASTKIEKTNKMLSQQLNECNSKIALMEREISYYKDKLVKYKAMAKSELNNDFSSNSQSSNGFFLSTKQSDLEKSTSQMIGASHNGNEPFGNGTSANRIKVSRKDLRKLTEEELLKRSLKKDNLMASSTNDNNLDDHI